MTATDACGLVTVDSICITVDLGDYVSIDCPTGPIAEQVLCTAGDVCLDLPMIGSGYEVTVSDGGTWEDNEVCFPADTSGVYDIMVVATAQCNVDTCILSVPVTILPELMVDCPQDDAPFLCGPDTLFYELTYAPVSANVMVSEPAFMVGDSIAVPVAAAGSQTITVTVSNQCGQVSCDFTVVSTFNTYPVATLGADVYDTVCSLTEICIPYTAFDADGNLEDVNTSLGTIGDDFEICFTPEAYGAYQMILTVTDKCGAVDTDTAVVVITEGGYASITCPDGAQFASVCGPDSVCILAPITPADAKVTVLPNGSYRPETGEICVYVTDGGTYNVRVIAEALCSSDTCDFNLEVDFGIPPELTCPGEIDTLLCLVEPTELCFDVPVVGTGVQVNVNPEGEYQAGVVCVPISEPGDYDYQIIAFGTCGADTCNVSVTVAADEEPVLTLPQTVTFERCPDDTNTICISGIFATDAESDVTITQVCGPEGAYTAIRPDSGRICFVPETFGLIDFCFEYTDGCHTDTGSFSVDIQLKDDCDVCVRVSVDGGSPTPVGLKHQVKVDIETNDAVGGFELLLNFDASALAFQNASMNDGAGDDWEYFTYNLNVGGGATTSGLVRFVGIADRK